MADLDAVIADLVIANRILGREGVCDAFGHIDGGRCRRSQALS
jgi:hypothetical protein